MGKKEPGYRGQLWDAGDIEFPNVDLEIQDAIESLTEITTKYLNEQKLKDIIEDNVYEALKTYADDSVASLAEPGVIEIDLYWNTEQPISIRVDIQDEVLSYIPPDDEGSEKFMAQWAEVFEKLAKKIRDAL